MSHSANPPTAPTRFELELEFVQLLANPQYLIYLAASKTLTQPEFVAYLKYLLYWTKPPYVQYLSFPAATLRALEMLQSEAFRKDVLRPEVGIAWEREVREGAGRR